MIRGLICKSIREIWLATVLFAAALAAVMSLLTFVLPQLLTGLNDAFSRMPFVKVIVSALLGIEVEGGLSAQLMQSILWVHPVVLALLWAHAMIVCTRVPAGEIDRGTADLLLGLPVTRRGIYLAESIVWLLAGAVLVLVGAAGHWATARVIPPESRPPVASVAWVLVNLYGIYLVVGSVSLLISSCSDRRGYAVGGIFSLLLISFLVNFLAPLWEPAKRIAWISFMHYYQPAKILQAGDVPWRNLAVLCAAAGVAWAAGGAIFARRDVCTT